LYQQLFKAVLDAFPTQAALDRMVLFGLDVNRHEIAGGDNLSDIVFNLIQWAVAQGQIVALVEAAKRENPNNPRISLAAEQIKHISMEIAPEFDPPSKPNRFAGTQSKNVVKNTATGIRGSTVNQAGRDVIVPELRPEQIELLIELQKRNR
jgi:hypothetical protein